MVRVFPHNREWAIIHRASPVRIGGCHKSSNFCFQERPVSLRSFCLRRSEFCGNDIIYCQGQNTTWRTLLTRLHDDDDDEEQDYKGKYNADVLDETYPSMLGCLSLFMSCTSRNMFGLLARCWFILSTITLPEVLFVTWNKQMTVSFIQSKVGYSVLTLYSKGYRK